MSDTNYTDFNLPAVNAAWLNTVNKAIYQAAGFTDAGPFTAARFRTGIGAEVAGTSAALAADLANNTNTAKGSALVGYLPAGAVGTTAQNKLGESVSVLDFGAKGDFNISTGAGTDDTSSIQAAITWCASNGRRLLQVGVSKITAPLTWPSTQIEIIGVGAVRTFDSGWAYRGAGTMVTGWR